MQITDDYKKKVVSALLEVRNNYDGPASSFTRQYGINESVFSRMKSGEITGLLKESKWLNIGRQLDVRLNERVWKTARTEVFETIEEDILFCQKYAKSRIYVDDSGIGKTYTAKYLSRTLRNCFYIDASQCKNRYVFTRELAKTVGIDPLGTIADVKANIKYYLCQLPNPIVIIDEAGDLDYPAFLDLKEYWNGTENACGWYMMGAEGLQEYIDRGIRGRKIGFRELFNRFSEKYSSDVPSDPKDRIDFYKKLISDVLIVNMKNKSLLPTILAKCITKGNDGKIGGLRRAESLLILHEA